MSYPYTMDKLIRTDDEKAWAADCANRAMALILTARLALENDTSGMCPDVERASVVADTLEIAYLLMSIASDGTEMLQRDAGIGGYRRDIVKGEAAR